MREYEQTLVETLYGSATAGESFGAPIVIKPIPDDDRGGVLDARQKAIEIAEASRPPFAPTLENLRLDCGKLNYNLNTVQMLTDCFDVAVGDGPVRVWAYRPRFPHDRADRSAVIYAHGGSFFAGQAAFLENVCRLLAEKADCVVFNVEYSLAPEHKWPRAVDEIAAVHAYLCENAAAFGIRADRIVASGDSAGGSLVAAAVGRDPARWAAQLLFYPCVDLMCDNSRYTWNVDDYELAECDRFITEPRLQLGRTDGRGNEALMQMITATYLPDLSLRAHPEVSPLYADLAEMPLTRVYTAEFDGLRVQGEYYAAALKKAGVDAKAVRYRGVTHAFVEKLGRIPQAEDAVRCAADEILRLEGKTV